MELKTAIAKLYTSEAQRLQQVGKPQDAVALYRQAITIEPDNYLHYYDLGLLMVQLKELDTVRELFERAIALKPNCAKIHYQLGNISLEQKQYAAGIESYRQAVAIEPKCDRFYYALGEALFKNSQLQESEVHFTKAVTLNEQNFWAYYYLGLIKRQQNQPQEAIAYFQKVITLDPQNEPGYWALQYTAVPDDAVTGLIDFYQRIIAQHPEVYLAWGNLGDLLSQQGQIPAAICCYQTSCYHQVTTRSPHLLHLNWHTKKEQPPDFIIVGASKCGTSSLFQYLNYHPQILLPHKKELNFFTPQNLDRGLAWYYSQFPAITDYEGLLTGEASPAYFNNPYARDNISQLPKPVKIIILLRNPVERVISWYYHNIKCGQEHRPLLEVITTEITKVQTTPPERIDYSCDYVADSIYLNKIKKWLEIISEPNILIIQTETLAVQPEATMKQVFDFLDLPYYSVIEYFRHNQGFYQSENHHQIVATLAEFFAPYNQQLETLLGRKFNW